MQIGTISICGQRDVAAEIRIKFAALSACADDFLPQSAIAFSEWVSEYLRGYGQNVPTVRCKE